MWPFNRDKSIKLYVVQKKDDPNYYYTITSTSNEALEYLMRLIVVERIDHYNHWCSLHDKDPNADENIFNYLSACEVNLYKDYYIKRIEYTPGNLAALMRVYNLCVPLGCKHETDFELAAFESRIKQEQEQQLIQK